MIRGLFATVLTACLVLVGGSAGGAPVTRTTVSHDVEQTFEDRLACGEDAPLYVIQAKGTMVEHGTEFPDGRFHFTFVASVQFVAEPVEPGPPSYTGRFTLHNSFNQTGDPTATFTFTWNVRGTGGDGSRLNTHVLSHFTETPGGGSLEFSRCR